MWVQGMCFISEYDMKIRRCGMIANETLTNPMLNTVETLIYVEPKFCGFVSI